MHDYRENDAILKVLGNDDQLYSLIARGIRKIASKNAGKVQPFQYVRFFIDYQEQRSMHALRTADLIKSFRSLKEDLLKQAIASVLCECMEKSEPQNDSFQYFLSVLTQLEQSSQPYLILSLFFAQMNREIGIEPFVDGCAGCGRSDLLCGISLQQGGFVCQGCYHKHDQLYDKNDLQSFRILCKANLTHVSLLETTQSWSYEHFSIIYRFFAEYSGISIRSVRFLSHLASL